MTKPKIAVLGTGDVGQRLATGFLKTGHMVMMGTRDPSKEEVRAWLKEAGPGAAAGTLAQAAQFGDVVVLATAWEGTENALTLAGKENLRGKVLVDVTNPLHHGPEGPSLAVGHTDSGGERVQRWVPGARVVKTLNVVTNAHMVAPDTVQGGPPAMFLCGNDEEAKRTVTQLLGEFGWKDPVDLGGIEGARLMEPLAMLWVAYGMRNNHWTHAFKLVGR